MNSSSFMDKQVMGLSGSQTDIFDLMNPQEEQPASINGGGGVGVKELKEEILPSYDFQPIRPVGAPLNSDNFEGSNVGGTRVWNSADHKTNSSNRTTRNYGSIDLSESAEVIQEKDRNSYVGVTMSEIDQTMKKHADNLLHALEGVSARLSQLDTRTRQIESSVDELKVSMSNNHGNNDGKLRQLENILREVQTGVQVLRDKQEIAEAHFQLTKLQTTKGEQQSENQNTTYHSGPVQQQAASAPQLSNQPAAPPVVLPQAPQPLPTLPSNSPLPQAQQNVPPVQHLAQLPQTQMPSMPQPEPHFPPPGQLPDATNQHYQLTPPGKQPQPPAPYQHYQSTNQLPHYSQPSHPPQQHPPHAPVNPSPQQLQPSLSHQPEETPYIPSQSYPPSIRQSPSVNQPPSSAPPSQPFYGAPAHMYEPPPPSNRPVAGFSSGYGGPPSGPSFSDPYPYSGSSHYGSSTMKPPQFSATPASSGGSSYPRIPTAQMLPQAVPTASSDGGGSSSSGSGNRVPIDDVVDKVATMGFSREQVRATVRKLTENGQSVDLNVVLDKLMNGR